MESLSVVIPPEDVLMDHQMPSALSGRCKNARAPTIPPKKQKHGGSDHCAPWYSMRGEHNVGSDHSPAATSLNEAVCATHCGIGIVSEVIKWGAELGTILSPDALTAPCPAKNHTPGPVSPASTAVTESDRERQLFLRASESAPLSKWRWNKGSAGEREAPDYLHLIAHPGHRTMGTRRFAGEAIAGHGNSDWDGVMMKTPSYTLTWEQHCVLI